jgi:hypothetical protein
LGWVHKNMDKTHPDYHIFVNGSFTNDAQFPKYVTQSYYARSLEAKHHDKVHTFKTAVCVSGMFAPTTSRGPTLPSHGTKIFRSGPKNFERDRLCMLGHLSRCHTKSADQRGPWALLWGPEHFYWAQLGPACMPAVYPWVLAHAFLASL